MYKKYLSVFIIFTLIFFIAQVFAVNDLDSAKLEIKKQTEIVKRERKGNKSKGRYLFKKKCRICHNDGEAKKLSPASKKMAEWEEALKPEKIETYMCKYKIKFLTPNVFNDIYTYLYDFAVDSPNPETLGDSITNLSMASSETYTIRLKSRKESSSSIYTSGIYAAFLTKTIIEVWNFVDNKKIATLTFEDFSSKIPEIDIENCVPEGIKLSWRDKGKIKKIMNMQKEFFIEHISLSADGGKVALTQRDGSVILWNTSSNKMIPLIPEGVSVTKLSPSGRYIGIINNRGKGKAFSIIDINKNKELISMPSNAGLAGIIEFSQNEANVYIGISEFIFGYELKTAKKILKTKIPIKFYNVKKGKAAISKDDKYFVCSADPLRGALVELSNEGRAKKLFKAKLHFFVKDALIVKADRDFKKIDFNKIDKFISIDKKSRRRRTDYTLFTTVNIPVEKGPVIKKAVETIVDSSFYSFRMEDELEETVVNITKVLF